MPGGMGVNLVKQFKQAGLEDKIPFLSAFTVDETTLPATQDAALGLLLRRGMGAKPRYAREQGLRRRLREGIWRRALALCGAGL